MHICCYVPMRACEDNIKVSSKYIMKILIVLGPVAGSVNYVYESSVSTRRRKDVCFSTLGFWTYPSSSTQPRKSVVLYQVYVICHR